MKTAKELDYVIHHLCIYDKDPRNHMWPYLKWHHGITNYFSGDTYHIADEGHADYTFLGCGGHHFQIQLEAPPFQFTYEQEWYKGHGNAYNHICWVVNNARESYDQICEAGADVCQAFQPFPTYDGFVVKDPEGRWIEIMEYTDPVFRVQEFTNAPSGPCGLEMLGFIEVVEDLERMVDWYCQAMGHQVLKQVSDGDDGLAVLGDNLWDPAKRNSLMILTTPYNAEDRAGFEKHGPHISGILYQAINVQAAFDDALWAGMEDIEKPTTDPLTGTLTARLREPSGNQIVLVEPPPQEEG
jgi:predicted enzyme related to lactoylglutathione lyase